MPPMASATTIEPARRKNLRTVVLLACLLVSVAIAWLLVQSRSTLVRNGSEIVAGLDAETLRSHWSRPQLAWQLVFDDRRSSGWSASAVQPRDDGGYDGLEVTYQTAGVRQPKVIWERWTLSADAKRGSYRAGTFAGLRGRQAPIDTFIELDAGQVRVRQILQGDVVDSTAEVPDNYAPEGTLDVLRAIVARQQTEATFALILNSLPPIDERPRFIPLHTRYVGTVERNGRTLIELRSEMETLSSRYLIDDSGRVVESRIGTLSRRQAGREKVLQAYPQAERVLQLVARLTEFAPATSTAPGNGGPGDPNAPAGPDVEGTDAPVDSILMQFGVAAPPAARR
jgi:hypothetical protein